MTAPGKLVRVNNGRDIAETVEVEHPLHQTLGRPIRERVQRVVTQTILDRWLQRRWISPRQHQAGDRLRAIIYRAGLEPRVTVNLDGSRGSDDPRLMMTTTERQAFARDAMRRALARLPDRLAGLAVAVCSDQESPSAYVSREGHRGTQATTIGNDRLKMALDVLADHFGI